MYCKVCGKKLPDDAVRCDECGTPVDGASAEDSYSQNQTNGGFYQDNRNQYSEYSEYSQEPVYERQSGARRGFAITSLVLGIVGLVGICCSFMTWGVLSILLGIAGLIFGILGLKSQSRGMAIAGIVMAVLNLIIGILLIVVIFVAFGEYASMSPDELENFWNQMEYYYQLDMVRSFLK